MTDHPDFSATAPEHRWTKPLHELAVRLREGAWRARGEWVYWVLPQGACVAMRVHGSGPTSFRKELRLSRRGIRKPDPALWLAEVKTFQKYLGCEGWDVDGCVERSQDDDSYHAMATLLEPAPLGKGVVPELTPALCSACGANVVAAGSEMFKEPLCTPCATTRGQADTDEYARERARPQDHQRKTGSS